MFRISNDDGRTWAKAIPSTVNNPDSGISMTKLKNGHVLLVYNDSPDARTPLNIVRSIDHGQRTTCDFEILSPTLSTKGRKKT